MASTRKRMRVAVVAVLATLVLSASLVASASADIPPDAKNHPLLQPIDAQNWVDQGELTWAAYKPIRPAAWNSAATSEGSENQYNTAIILVDYPDQPFLITQAPGAHPFGNPQPGWQPIPREGVNEWFRKYYAEPNQYNGGQTLHAYWMEDSHGRIGVDVRVFGPYRMPHNSWQYGFNEFSQNTAASNQCPAQANLTASGTATTSIAVSTTDFFYVGDVITITHDTLPPAQRPNPNTSTRTVTEIPNGNTLVVSQPVTVVSGGRTHDCGRDIRTDAGALWRAELGCPSGLCGFDNGFYVTAGHDESSTWQEFGEMLYEDREDVPDVFGNPNPNLPNWANTRYVPWTSWLAASNHWPNAGGGTSTQAESSGQSVFAHEFSHLRGLPDNYNNPYADNERSGTGYWEMMSRGTFNGPGGTHNRWQIPNQGGSALGPHHTLEYKTRLNVLGASEHVEVQRDTLAAQGTAVVSVKAREYQPNGNLAGFTVRLGPGENGDLSGSCANQGFTGDAVFYCPNRTGNPYSEYRLEVVERVGNDSFAPGHGVLLSKSRPGGLPTVWLIDPNPDDIGMIDFYRPDGTPVAVLRGDPRQLNDATFHAGTNSGSEYEYVDPFNKLHFYVLRTYRNPAGELLYDVAVRRTEGASPFARGVGLGNPTKTPQRQGFLATCTFPLTNTGQAGTGIFGSDVFRVSATSSSPDWKVTLPNALASATAGQTVQVPVHVLRDPLTDDGDARTTVTLTAKSESDASKTATRTCAVHVRDTTPAGG
jgi:M6 family metalloprotease-like protein